MSVIHLNAVREDRDQHREFTARKLALLDVAVGDHRLTHLDYRVFAYVASAVDRSTFVAKRKQSTIAATMNCAVRAVQQCLERIRLLGYVCFEFKEGGTYVHAYSLPLEKANRDPPFSNEKTNGSSSFSNERRTGRSKKANGYAAKGERPFVHDLPLNSPELPPRAPSGPDGLGAPGAYLRAKHGDNLYRSWFSKLSVVACDGELVKLTAPTQFIADRVNNLYGADILDAWRSINAGVASVIVDVERKVAAHG